MCTLSVTGLVIGIQKICTLPDHHMMDSAKSSRDMTDVRTLVQKKCYYFLPLKSLFQRILSWFAEFLGKDVV